MAALLLSWFFTDSSFCYASVPEMPVQQLTAEGASSPDRSTWKEAYPSSEMEVAAAPADLRMLHSGAKWFLTGICVSLLLVLFLYIVPGNDAQKSPPQGSAPPGSQGGYYHPQAQNMHFPLLPMIPVAFTAASQHPDYLRPGAPLDGTATSRHAGYYDPPIAHDAEGCTGRTSQKVTQQDNGFDAGAHSQGNWPASLHRPAGSKNNTTLELDLNPFGVPMETEGTLEPPCTTRDKKLASERETIVQHIVRENMELKRAA
jgi:hypothetical protein